MTEFLFEDIFMKSAFKTFFQSGKEFEANFMFEVAFGFMPREFSDDADDRYLFEEEGDATEIYFIMKGDWAICFDSYAKDDLQGMRFDEEGQTEDEAYKRSDMTKRGLVIALRKVNYGYIGDYYVLASKRAQFYYVALSQITAYALTKQFMFKYLFAKFPGIRNEMLATSFATYIKEIRKPCGIIRDRVI